MADDLDSIVKGAPIAEAAASDANANANAKPGSGASPFSPGTGAGKPGDPLHHTPSSPSMIYLNLLILEASMRAQFLELRARKRHHTFFLAILTLWVAFFGYKLYFAPREDGRGVGGSIYWAVEGAQKVCFMGGIITAALVWATGIWDRGIRWPRRWFAISNRGLRGFNCKLVIIRQTWWAEALSTIGFFLTYGLFSHTASSSYRLVEPQLLRQVEKELQLTSDNHPTLVLPPDDDELGGHEEDLAPGGDYVKLLLLPKPFSPTFRENWELYRTEYWERENERRRLLRQKVKEHDRKVAKDQYGWLWWLPWHQSPQPRIRREPQKMPHHRLASSERKRRNSSVRRSSVSSSRSQTPLVFDSDGQTTPRKQALAADKRRKQGSISKVKRPSTDSRSVTPDIPSRLSRESSVTVDTETDGSSGRTLRSTSKRASPAPLSAD
ncbi:Spo7 domain-containing protein [Trichoderma sp. SZMC 28012]|uniref:Spo7 n=1 Tax=Trichoderma guizhouense TaxID=1491466 RepID=A0A1T3CB74_9HYPO|nr:spo7 [Trichoderma guizhouense]